MGELMEECLMGESCKRTDSDLPAALCVTLRVAVQVLELNPMDVQSLKRLLLAPFGNSGRPIFRAFRLRENKPMGLVVQRK